jgi:hypothetical protein
MIGDWPAINTEKMLLKNFPRFGEGLYISRQILAWMVEW